MFFDAAQRLEPAEFDQIASLLAAWQAQAPKMGVLLLVAEKNQSAVPAFQAAARGLNVDLMGAIFPALVVDEGFVDQGAWVIRFDVTPNWALVGALNDTVHNSAKKIAHVIEPMMRRTPHDNPPVLSLVFDAMLPSIGSLLNELWKHLHRRVIYTGFNAGSETFAPMPCLFDAHQHIGEAVLCMLCPPQTDWAVRHGYPVSSTQMMATSTAGNRIAQINGRPAFEVYQEVIKAEYGVDLTQDNFYDYAVHYPFGLVAMVDVHVRIPVAFGDDGSLFCVGEVPPESVLRLIRAPDLEQSHCVDELVSALHRVDAEESSPSRVLMACYCAGRRMHFGEDAAGEIRLLKTQTLSQEIVGVLTLGEIDSMEDLGIPTFHNAAIVCLR